MNIYYLILEIFRVVVNILQITKNLLLCLASLLATLDQLVSVFPHDSTECSNGTHQSEDGGKLTDHVEQGAADGDVESVLVE